MHGEGVENADFICYNAQITAHLIRLETKQVASRCEIDTRNCMRKRKEAIVAMVSQINTTVRIGRF